MKLDRKDTSPMRLAQNDLSSRDPMKGKPERDTDCFSNVVESIRPRGSRISH